MVTPPVVLPRTPSATGYSVEITTSGSGVEEAQRLRHRVFAEELGASLAPGGLDVDEWDGRCEHLLVRSPAGAVVGTYRILPPDPDRASGYSDGEFDLTALTELRPSLVEVGRSCVDPAHRSGAVIGLLWAGLARYLLLSGHRYLGGCASVPLADGVHNAATVVRDALRRHRAPAAYTVRPHVGWEYTEYVDIPKPVVPPLLRAYLRLGAWVCGEPALDEEFGTADLYVLLPIDRVDQRIMARLLGATR